MKNPFTKPNRYSFLLRQSLLLAVSCFLAISAWATTFPVSTKANDGAGSLRQAILDANADGSATAANPHLITFSVIGTITVVSPFLVVTNHVLIQGPGQAALTLSGGNATRIFWLQNGAITIRDLTLANGLAKGGDGGGGGMGAGGAIFMHEGREGGSGSLAVQLINVTLTGNSAQGGSAIDPPSRGGGGMGGTSNYFGGGGVIDNTSSEDGSSVSGKNNGGIVIFGSGGTGRTGGGGGFGGGGGAGSSGFNGYKGGPGGFSGGGGAGGLNKDTNNDEHFGRGGDGGDGGFGGGGGSGRGGGGNGGGGGYGGGGGGGYAYGGGGGFGGGNAGTTVGAKIIGGGGMGAGGAIFVTSGRLTMTNVSLTNNSATGGTGGAPGAGLGGAIFLFNKADNGGTAAPGTTNDPTVSACALTFSGNTATYQNNQPGRNDNNQYGAFPVTPGVAITQQPPSSSMVITGTNVKVSALFSGPVDSFQWYKEGTPVAGQTTPDLRLDNVTLSQAGSYSLVATGACTSVTTTAFNLSVVTPATLSGTKTVAGSFTPGGTITYTIVLTNSGQLTQGDNQGPELEDQLPSSLSVIQTAATSGSVSAVNARLVRWNGSLTAGSSVTITIGALVNPTNPVGQPIANQASINYDIRNEGVNRGIIRTDDPGTAAPNDATVFVATCPPPPALVLGNDGPLGCAKATVTLTASGASQGSTYVFSGGASPVGNTATVSMAGLYSVTATAPNGCTATATTAVSVIAPPTVSINPTSATLTCASPAISLTAIGTGSVRWSTGSTSPVISVSTAGTYSVTLTSADGCTATASTTIAADQTAPTVSISPTSATLSCTSPGATLTASGPGTFRWSTGSTDPQITVSTSGTYSVTLTGANGCPAVASATVSGDQTPPRVSITPTSAMLSCTNPVTNLTAVGTGSVRWSTGETSPVISVSTAGTYSVTLTSASGCVATASVTVSGDQRVPQVSISPSSASLSCTTPMVSLTAQGSGTLRWSTGETSPVISVSVAGTYSVTLTGPNGCSASATATLTGTPTTPPVSLSNDGPLTCTRPSVTLTASSTAMGATYTFRGPQGTVSSNGNTASVSAPGTYTVTLTSNGCSATAMTTVGGSSALPILTISPSVSTVCAGSPATLTATGGPAGATLSYRWSTGATSPSISVSAATSTTYSVTATTSGGCSATATARLTVNPRPAAPYLTPVPRTLYTTSFPIPLIIYALPTGFGLDLNFYQAGTNALLDPPLIRPTQSGSFDYYATQTDSKGCVSGPAAFSLKVLEGGTLVSKPADQTVCQGSSTVLSVTATGGNLKYSWYEANPDTPLRVSEVGTDTKGGKTASLTVNQVRQSKLYYCLVIGDKGIGVAGPIKVGLRTNCGSARQAVSAEPGTTLSAVVLGNPVTGDQAEVEVSGAQGQALQLRLVDTQGRLVSQQQRASAQGIERVSLSVSGQSAGLFFLQVSTSTQQLTVKILKR